MLSLDYTPINFIFFEEPLLLHLMLRKVNKALMKNNYRSSQKNLRDGELNPDLARDKRPFWPLNYHGRNKALTMGVEPIIFWLEVRRVAITPRELLFVGRLGLKVNYVLISPISRTNVENLNSPTTFAFGSRMLRNNNQLPFSWLVFIWQHCWNKNQLSSIN